MTEDKASFDQRLRAARERSAGKSVEQEAQPDRQDKNLLSLAARAGSEMLGGLVAGVLIGWGVDHVFHFRALFMVIFALLGGCAGILNVWRLMKSLEEEKQES
ncbi:ATP synthase F0 subunit iota [Acetobacter estunensis NRIC 0472]|uniref:F0F1 ATP synthase assembly protein I n=1 Tax=Acetobacter estunensis TaxID=104097 RepID=A0A967B4G6_9PROT|nr:AtpZ/AtpI family protein [Acetobacter estunensis]MBV1836335.1 AtpZ/AtpI family protein [Acetobacter estunensis]NHO52680.1 F0F1 ATP synthase assembly protein I [Acetobacter estunensis]GBQ22889.1 ATP synthase F0 subunit iota [Acetobacter estunensis NRIC 0472]